MTPTHGCIDTRSIVRRALRMLPVVLLAACATTTPGSGGGTDQGAAAPLAWLVPDEVLVLPLQEVELPLTDDPGTFDDLAPVTVASVRQRFDNRLRAMVEPQVPPDRWVWPQSLAALRARNPTVMPDPARLTMSGLRPGMPAQSQLGQQLGSELRSLLAVSGARRYALLPFRLVVRGDPASGERGYAIHMLVIDTRRAIVARAVSDSRDRVGAPADAVDAAVTAVASMLISREQ
ncbi:MAG TPA: hypothetical protein VMM17_02235 [Gemmatimonadaceae bacterium]|nr:hypothetical protein [Gemmatimonadaceae bacterium]